MGSSKAKSEHCLRTYEEIGILFAQIIKEMYPTLRRERAGSRVTLKHPGRSLDRYCMYTYILLSFFFLLLSSLLCPTAMRGLAVRRQERVGLSLIYFALAVALSVSLLACFFRVAAYIREVTQAIPAILDHYPDYAPYSTPHPSINSKRVGAKLGFNTRNHWNEMTTVDGLRKKDITVLRFLLRPSKALRKTSCMIKFVTSYGNDAYRQSWLRAETSLFWTHWY
jgi:hypothetical protein